ncbi:Npun_R2821/Npun_R2822 family protein [Baaleninema sp.]|uniref:Npun_R2821/Npun_R2822 family protein n=1 Tax=Baaleninema sp. TaxID=3101197 RepID=UPI003CFF5CB8
MIPSGIYTLANDVVFDQLVAWLNSVEANVSPDIPICIFPYDDRLERTKAEIAQRPNVFLFEDEDALQRWDDFAKRVWLSHPRAKRPGSRSPWYLGHHHRRYAAFQGVFEKFIFYDADTLAMKPVDEIFKNLDTYDFVFDDWEHRKPRPVAAFDFPYLESTGKYTEEELRPSLHCASFFASKQGLLSWQDVEEMERRLVEENEIAWINEKLWWDDAAFSNYLTLWRDRPLFNYTQSDNPQDRTGNCAVTDRFVNLNNVLYNEQGMKPIHRLHYMTVPSSAFARLCQGEDVDIPYRDIFLHYRFLKEPEKRPKELKPPSMATQFKRKVQSGIQKLRKLRYYVPGLVN